MHALYDHDIRLKRFSAASLSGRAAYPWRTAELGHAHVAPLRQAARVASVAGLRARLAQLASMLNPLPPA
eukprot:6200678-Pleurochrysis_carterae.AAC.3